MRLYTNKPSLIAILLLLVATWLRTWQLDHAPPGLHHDEVINAQIVENEIFAGHPAIFYSMGGREGLFHLTSAASMRLFGYNPIGFRWPGLAWGMIGLAACYALAARLLGRRAALVGLAFAATSFWSIYEGRAATRSVSLIAVGSMAALFFWIAWRKRYGGYGKPPYAEIVRFAWAGGWLGLSLYTYIAARVLPAVFVLFIAYLAITQRRMLTAGWRGLAAYAITAMVVGTPLVIHLYTHPSADMRFQMLAGPLAELQQGRLGPVLQTGLQTLGMFVWRGDPQWHYNVAGTPVFEPLSALLFLAGLALAIRRIGRPAYAFYLIWLAVSLLPGMLSQPAPHYMRTAGAQSAAYSLLGLGGAALANGGVTFVLNAVKGLKFSSAYRRLAWLGIALVWLNAALQTGRAFFVVWPANDEVRFYHQANVSDMARYLDSQADTRPVVGCSVFLNEHEDWLRSPRQTMPYLLRRRDLPIRWHDCRDSLIFPNGGNSWRQFILYLTPLEENISPKILNWFGPSPPLSINAFNDITLYKPDARVRLASALLQAGQAEIAWSPEAGGGQASVPVDFGHSLEFLGYKLEKSALTAGESLNLTTYWRASGQSPPFLTVFVHLLDRPDHVVAQVDRQSVLADSLQVGDVMLQVHGLDLSPELAAGEYWLSIGLYSSQTGQRLPIYQGQTPRGDRLMLQTVTVQPK